MISFKYKNSKGYLETDKPLVYTADITKAFSYSISSIIDLVDTSVIDTFMSYVAVLCLDIGKIECMVGIYEDTKEIGIITLTDKGLGLDVESGVDKDTADALREFCGVLAGYIVDLKYAMKTKPEGIDVSKTMEDLAKKLSSKMMDMEGGEFTETNIDKLISEINKETKATIVKPKEQLSDYICNSILKEELEEIVDFFVNNKTYTDAGIVIPKGVLLYGEPGTGKTYAARCIAGTVDCYFMTCTASSLQGMYIGSGADNIRKVFKGANALATASGKGVIIFIDEIDSFGSRGNSRSGAGGEEDRTINQLLAEMSGFEDTANIMVLAATNYKDRLDDALVRSGRFGRQINIETPNETERLNLVQYYFDKIKFKLEPTVSYDTIVGLTEGFTPADIKEISNETGILTVRQKLSNLTLENINEAINKCITKNIRNEDGNPEEISLVSVHESGHALAEVLLFNTIPTKMTSYSYGSAGGFTQNSVILEGIMPKSKYINYIKILLGGRAAEETIYANITNGASNDLKRAKKILYHYYETYHFEEYKAAELDQIVLDTLNKLYKETVELFMENRKILNELSNALCTERVLYAEDIAAITGKVKGGIL